jgi:hypothetical protein
LAIQWMDDFTCYGTDTNRALRMLDGPYAEITRVALVADPDPTSAGAMVLQKFGGGLGGDFRKVLNSTQTTIGVAGRYWFSSMPADSTIAECHSITSFRDVNNISHIRIRPNSAGYLVAVRTDNGVEVQLGITSTPVLTANAWRHIEVKVVLDVAAGSVEIRVEGITVLNVTGVRTTTNIGGANANCGQVAQISPQNGSAPVMYTKDFIIWDNTTGANNTFMGSCQVIKLIPNGDTTLGWTPSTGTTGYNLINETTPDDDGTYISAPFPLPGNSQFTLTDLPVNVSTVRGVQLMHRSRKTDGGDGNIQASAVSGANTGNGADRPITTAYTYMWDIFDLDPSGSAWSRTLVNALQLKLNRTV